MAATATQSPLGDLPAAYLGLIRAQARWGQDLYEAVTGMPSPSLTDALQAWSKAAPKPVCHVPPPCWMPRSLGECTSHVNACGRARLRLVITNCDRSARTVHARAEGAEGVSIEPASVHLGPMQRGRLELSLTVPESAAAGTRIESLIWVDGCRQHYLRWTISVGSAGLDSCHELQVDDCQDHRHHWYDHFYCHRPCSSTRSNASG